MGRRVAPPTFLNCQMAITMTRSESSGIQSVALEATNKLGARVQVGSAAGSPMRFQKASKSCSPCNPEHPRTPRTPTV
eukprot:4091877-Amphidinium_carterae.2